MNAAELCVRKTVVIGQNESVLKAARLMRDHHVGSLVVVLKDGGTQPIWIVTDRDLTISVLADDLRGPDVPISQVMSGDLLTVPETRGAFEALEEMRLRGVRRAPVVDRDGQLIGILTIDDILDFVSEEMGSVIRLFKTEQEHEQAGRRAG